MMNADDPIHEILGLDGFGYIDIRLGGVSRPRYIQFSRSDLVAMLAMFDGHEEGEKANAGPLSAEMEISSTALFGEDDTTERGFGLVKFRDEYGEQCSLQISSLAVCENEDGTVDNPLGWIWLGIDDAKPQIMKTKARELGLPLPPGDVSAWMPYPVPDDVLMTTRMHLNEAQVRGLIARLQTWLEHGQFVTPNNMLTVSGGREKTT